MNINSSITRSPEGPTALTLSLTGKETVEAFQALLARALNTWPDCPNEWKELADYIEYGEALQDYNTIYQPWLRPRSL